MCVVCVCVCMCVCVCVCVCVSRKPNQFPQLRIPSAYIILLINMGTNVDAAIQLFWVYLIKNETLLPAPKLCHSSRVIHHVELTYKLTYVNFYGNSTYFNIYVNST